MQVKKLHEWRVNNLSVCFCCWHSKQERSMLFHSNPWNISLPAFLVSNWLVYPNVLSFVLVLTQVHRPSVFMVIPVKKIYCNIKTTNYCSCCKTVDWNYPRELKESRSGYNCVQSCSFGLREGWQPFGYLLPPAKGRVSHCLLGCWSLGTNFKAFLARASAFIIANKSRNSANKRHWG